MYVTLYHACDAGYKRKVLENVKIHFSEGIKANENGYSQSNSCVMRIFTDEDINLKPEDKIVIGISDMMSEDALTVLRVTDNRVGTHKHWKAECI